MFHQMRVELCHQDRVDRVPIPDRLKDEPVSQCSSNMLSVAPKDSAVLSIKYQYFLALPGLAIAVSLLLTLYSKLVLGNGLMSLKKFSKAKNMRSACVDTGHQAGSETSPAPHKT